MQFERVQPGDLITANLINRIVSALEELDGKVDDLSKSAGATLGPVILEIQPAGPWRLNQEIRVIGRNFAEPANRNDVSIGGVPIVRFSESSSALLAFTIPASIPGTPGDATLVVRSGDRSDSLIMRINAAVVIPRGRLVITDKTPPLGTIEVGKTLTFVFEADSRTNVGETYTFEPVFTDAVGASVGAWLAATTFPGVGATPVLLQPGEPRTVQLRTVVPAGATSVNVALGGRSHNNPAELSSSSSPIKLDVGSPITPSDPRTTITLAAFGAFAKARRATINGIEGVEMPFQQGDLVRVNMQFTVAGSYQYTAAIEPDHGLWARTDASPASTEETAGSSEAVGITLTLNSPPTNASHPERRTLVFRARHTTQNFESFTRLPIQGFTPTT